MPPAARSSTGVAQDSLLEALAVLVRRDGALEQLVEGLHVSVDAAIAVQRPDLATVWNRVAELAICVAEDLQPSEVNRGRG